jgi:hypothetical protein
MAGKVSPMRCLVKGRLNTFGSEAGVGMVDGLCLRFPNPQLWFLHRNQYQEPLDYADPRTWKSFFFSFFFLALAPILLALSRNQGSDTEKAAQMPFSSGA